MGRKMLITMMVVGRVTDRPFADSHTPKSQFSLLLASISSGFLVTFSLLTFELLLFYAFFR